jgi:hypothetical protein
MLLVMVLPPKQMLGNNSEQVLVTTISPGTLISQYYGAVTIRQH